MGYYALAAETAMTAGTWAAARSSLACALAAQRHVAGHATRYSAAQSVGQVADLAADRAAGPAKEHAAGRFAAGSAAFALCRPPGHHAAIDMFGGYCFLNNAAATAQAFLQDGAERVAILDIDFHHGNGTQDIFYQRADLLFASLHGHPEDAYPFFTGYADETGEGAGEGSTVNYPMRPGTGYALWCEALDRALKRVAEFGAETLVVSLGVDAYKQDPISFFTLESADFSDCGRRIAALRLPTVFIMEGGYAIEAVGINTVNVLTGFADG